MPKHFEDYAAGDTVVTATVTVSEAEILEFARKYDPQPFHIDSEAATQSIYGGIIASGWHTAALAMRLLVDSGEMGAGMGSPGIDTLRWLKPLRPGDTIHVRSTVIKTRRSRSKPDRGLLRFDSQLLNQHGEIIMTWQAMGLVRCRSAAPEAAPR